MTNWVLINYNDTAIEIDWKYYISTILENILTGEEKEELIWFWWSMSKLNKYLNKLEWTLDL